MNGRWTVFATWRPKALLGTLGHSWGALGPLLGAVGSLLASTWDVDRLSLQVFSQTAESLIAEDKQQNHFALRC